MRIYNPPKAIGPKPEWKLDEGYEVLAKRERQWLNKLRKWCQEHGKGTSVGEEVRFPHADGYARYMVMDHKCLIWIPLGDAWHFPYIERLRWSDIEENIIRRQKLDSIFGKRKVMKTKEAK